MSLISTVCGFELHLGAPWVRSLPVGALRNLVLTADGRDVPDVAVDLAGQRVGAADLAASDAWWVREEQLILNGRVKLTPGRHEIDVKFDLEIPYLHDLWDTPVAIPFHLMDTFLLDAAS